MAPGALPVSLGLALGCGVLGLVCLRTSLIPNTLCRAEISLALDTMARTGNHRKVERQLIAAAEFDRLNPEPWMWLLQLRAKSEAGVFSEETQEAGAEAILRNPASPLTYELLGDLSAKVEPASAESRTAAIQWYREAAKRYPNSARIRSSLALAQRRAGHREAAAQEAKHALHLDDLNQSAGHVDKILPSETRKILEEAVGKSSRR